jgi:tetratricopeptide (TPR) repeat protein
MEGDAAIQNDCDGLAALDLESLDDDMSRAWHLARTCKRQEQAIEAYTRIIDRAPHWADPYYRRGVVYWWRAEHEKALADYDRAIERAPAWADPYRLRGLIHSTKKRYDEALADIGRALELQPESADAFFNRAQVYMQLERFEDALPDIERCLELLPRAINTPWLQAITLLRLGREEEALAAVDQAIEDHPDRDAAIQRRVNLLLLMGRTNEAMETAERAVEHSPKNASNYFYRARAALLGDGGCGRALADLATARELAPDDPDVASEIAWVHAVWMYLRCPDSFDGDLALDLSRTAVEDKPGDGGRQITHGMVLYRHGRFGEAREALLRALELPRFVAEEATPKPEPAELFGLAMTEFKLGNGADARGYYDRAVARMNETYPRFPEYRLLQKEAAELLGIQP